MKESVFFVCLFFFFDNKRKIFKSNLVFAVVFVPESEGLYYLAVADPGEPPPPPPPQPYFNTKLRPGEGPKKKCLETRPRLFKRWIVLSTG